ncbi:hypothetical protein LMG29660_07130 [Burkholderia puraquae]|uniref:Uncharacterized protein n=1 Tax=Burkholderia puraquae TaxID=1904757 RepID=A0A6J5F1V0_9BURK|nr:hypothetical protein LMG29660_07130 [Burkholderia puraquae]
MRIWFASMARVTGVPGRLARRICKKVLQGDGSDRHHSSFEFVLLTISMMLTIGGGSKMERTRPGGATRFSFARAGDRLSKTLARRRRRARNVNPGCDNLPGRGAGAEEKRVGINVSGTRHPAGGCRSVRFRTVSNRVTLRGRRGGPPRVMRFAIQLRHTRSDVRTGRGTRGPGPNGCAERCVSLAACPGRVGRCANGQVGGSADRVPDTRFSCAPLREHRRALCLCPDARTSPGLRHGLGIGVQSMATVADGSCVALEPASAVNDPA